MNLLTFDKEIYFLMNIVHSSGLKVQNILIAGFDYKKTGIISAYGE